MANGHRLGPVTRVRRLGWLAYCACGYWESLWADSKAVAVASHDSHARQAVRAEWAEERDWAAFVRRVHAGRPQPARRRSWRSSFARPSGLRGARHARAAA